MDSVVALDVASDRRERLAETFGDPTAFRAWYDDAVGRVYSYLFGRCGGDVEVAEEITQQTFLQAVRHWQSFDGRADPITWLCTIARNKLADHYRERDRQRRRHLQLVVREIEPDVTSPNQAIDDRDAIMSALRQLPDIERTALILRYLDDLSVRDVATTLGRSIDATDAVIRRAKERFRSIYPEAFDE